MKTIKDRAWEIAKDHCKKLHEYEFCELINIFKEIDGNYVIEFKVIEKNYYPRDDWILNFDLIYITDLDTIRILQDFHIRI